MKPAPILLSALAVAGAIAVLFLSRRTTSYWNPVDSTNYVARWRSYRPETFRQQVGRTKLDHVRLLSEQDAFEREVGVDPLVYLCKSIDSTVSDVAESGTASYELLVEASLSPDGRPRFQLASRGQAPDEELQRIQDALNLLPPLNTRGAELRFQMVFSIGQGGN